MYIRILKPLEFRKEKKGLAFKSQESTNCREAESTFPGLPDDDGMVTSSNNDVTTLWNVDVNRLIARKRFVPRKRSLPYSVGSFNPLDFHPYSARETPQLPGLSASGIFHAKTFFVVP